MHPSNQPSTPSADEEIATPRTDQAQREYRHSEESRPVKASFARQLERENAALVQEREALDDKVSDLADERDKYATTILSLRATLAERDREITGLNEAWNNALTLSQTLGTELETLRAQLVERDERLKEAEKVSSEWQSVLFEERRGILALQAHVEKLREGLEETATIFDDLDTVQWDENGCPVTYQGTQDKIIKLLSSQLDLTLIEEVREGIQSLVERFRTWDAGGQTSYGYVYGGHIHVAGNLRDEWYRDADQLLTRLNPRK